MLLNQNLQLLIRDPVRQVQLFMLCRQTGVLLSSIVIARTLPLNDVGVMEMLFLCGYLMTFLWSDALLKGYLAVKHGEGELQTATSFMGLCLMVAGLSMLALWLGQSILLPLLVDRTALPGLHLFVIYQMLILPVWIAPFIGVLRRWHPLMLATYVLMGPAVACYIGWVVRPDLIGILFGLIGYAMVGFFLVVIQSPIVLRYIGGWNILKQIWPATWPLILYALSIGLARAFDAWLVARHFDASAFAIFRYGAREFPLVMALAAGVSTIMIPRLRSNEALPELRARSVRLMHICFPLVGILMVLSPYLFVYLFGPDYKESALIFNVYLLLTLTQLVFPQSVLTSRGDTKLLWYSSLGELAVNVIASLLLLPWFGLAGIAMGTFIAFVFEKVILLIVVRRRYGIEAGQLTHSGIWMGYALGVILVFCLVTWMSGV